MIDQVTDPIASSVLSGIQAVATSSIPMAMIFFCIGMGVVVLGLIVMRRVLRVLLS